MKKRWNDSDLKKLAEKGLVIEEQFAEIKIIEKDGTSITKKVAGDSEKAAIEWKLWILVKQGKIKKYVKELQFDEHRKFRFDWAIPELMIGIEYEGLMSEKSGHTTISGYTKDCEKYNLATKNGWKVLRYTALNFPSLVEDIEHFIRKL
jgi:hypothetical protein